jgi:hypothetical protein
VTVGIFGPLEIVTQAGIVLSCARFTYSSDLTFLAGLSESVSGTLTSRSAFRLLSNLQVRVSTGTIG